jgi:hypothetical protein
MSGVKTRLPLLIVYVPWFAIVTDVALQFGDTWLVAGSQSLRLEATRVSPLAAVSLVSTVMLCAVFQGPVEVSGLAVGAAGTIGVKLDEAVRPAWSVTR